MAGEANSSDGRNSVKWSTQERVKVRIFSREQRGRGQSQPPCKSDTNQRSWPSPVNRY